MLISPNVMLTNLCPFPRITTLKYFTELWAVVVTKLAEWSLIVPVVQGFNPVIRKKLTDNC